tara:strand:- start:2837 stop:3127 length:291 start_codon:yes stop_codon:yes gene_type:complete
MPKKSRRANRIKRKKTMTKEQRLDDQLRRHNEAIQQINSGNLSKSKIKALQKADRRLLQHGVRKKEQNSYIGAMSKSIEEIVVELAESDTYYEVKN